MIEGLYVYIKKIWLCPPENLRNLQQLLQVVGRKNADELL